MDALIGTSANDSSSLESSLDENCVAATESTNLIIVPSESFDDDGANPSSFPSELNPELLDGLRCLQLKEQDRGSDISSASKPQSESSTETGDKAASSRTVEVSDEPVEEETISAQWKLHSKHVFVLSESGKPIYSRHGDEDKLVTLMGVMQAIVSFVEDTKDALRFLIAGEHRFAFLHKDHLIAAVVARNGRDSPQQLSLLLNYVHNQIISMLTLTQVNRIFKDRKNYDLRRLLSGADLFLNHLVDSFDRDPSYFLIGIQCLPLAPSVRDAIGNAIVQGTRSPGVVFSILIAENRIVNLVRKKDYILQPSDLHLILNMVSAAESFKNGESWTPICLPKFTSSGFLHAHISYIDVSCKICLLLLTTEKEQFYQLSECKSRIVERMQRHNMIRSLTDAIQEMEYRTSQIGISELLHFIFKSRSNGQFTSPRVEAPYQGTEGRERLTHLYKHVHTRMHCTRRPLKLYYHVAKDETLFGWITSSFELYSVFSPLITKPEAIHAVNRLLKWVKKDEERLFIINSPVF